MKLLQKPVSSRNDSEGRVDLPPGGFHMLKIYGLFALVSVILCAGCSAPSDDVSDTTVSPQEMVVNDLHKMNDYTSPSVADFDLQNRNLFSAIFGGENGAALRTYLDARIHYYYTPSELASFRSQPADFIHKGWYTDAAKQTVFGAEGKAVLGAANIGTQLWLSGLVDQTPVTVFAEDRTIPVSDSRVGLMLIGPGYDAFIHATNGNDYEVPSGYRQSILLHEARHSDCTGGISEDDLNVLRMSPNAQWTDANFKDRECGHLHTYCPPGHDLAGKLACDDLAWGAYAVQYVYVQATINDYVGADRAIMEATLADLRSRLLFDVDDMMMGQMGAPDMSTSGVHQ